MVVLSFVHDHGAADHAVWSAEFHKGIPVRILSFLVEAGLDLLNITDAAFMDVQLGISLLGTVGVENSAVRHAAVLQVAELMDF